MGSPLVTCVCITRNRRQWLPLAIRCFQEQTYPAKELLIVSEGEDVRDLLPKDDRIRVVHIAEGMNIGAKRNYAAEQASGTLIAHWDDDDWSAPERLTDQVNRLEESGKAVTGYSDMLFTDGLGWWLYTGVRGRGVGTSLCYQRAWWQEHPFNNLQSGEDWEFVSLAFRREQSGAVEAGIRMVASAHRGNTSPRPLHNSPNFKRADPPAALLMNAGVLTLSEIARAA